eukprot:349641-Chlamydomonas_euryale.AAC.13
MAASLHSSIEAAAVHRPSREEAVALAHARASVSNGRRMRPGRCSSIEDPPGEGANTRLVWLLEPERGCATRYVAAIPADTSRCCRGRAYPAAAFVPDSQELPHPSRMGRSSETGARGLLHLMCGCFTERGEEQQDLQQPPQCDDAEDGAAKHGHFASRAGEITGIIGTDVTGTPASLSSARQVYQTIPASYGQDASDRVGGQPFVDTGNRLRYGDLSTMAAQSLSSGQSLQAQPMAHVLQGQLMQPMQQMQARQVMQPMQPMQACQPMQPMQQMYTVQPMQQAHAHGDMQHTQPMQQVSMQHMQPMQQVPMQHMQPMQQVSMQHMQPMQQVTMQHMQPMQQVSMQPMQHAQHMHTIQFMQPMQPMQSTQSMQPMQLMMAAQSRQTMGERQQGQAHQSMPPIQPNHSPLVQQAMQMNQAVQ